MSRTPPRLLMALALVAAAALAQLSVVFAMVGLSGGDVASTTSLGLLTRIQFGTYLLDVGVLVLVPLAVLLSRPSDPDRDAPPPEVTRTLLVGATAVGAASVFLLVLRLVADLGTDGNVLTRTVPGALVYDLGLMLVAASGTFWAYRELEATPPARREPPSPPPPAPAPASPTPPPMSRGFPTGPPLAPPPPEQPPPS